MKNCESRSVFLRSCFAISAALLVASSLLSSCATAEPAPVQGVQGVKVTVLLFSGRPDPTFQLTEPEQLRLSALVKDAPRLERLGREEVIPAILGYKGIVVENAGGPRELPARLAVYGGSIEVGTERREFRADQGNRFASYLLELAIQKGVIPEPVVRRIKEQGLR